MSPTRREALAQLAALVALPLPRWGALVHDPLDGTVADYQAGRVRGKWTAATVTAHAIERCRSMGATWHAIDALADTALADARASDARRRAGRLRGPLDGVPVFAKAIYDMNGLPTTGSSAEWARLFPDPVRRDALEVSSAASGRRDRPRQDSSGRFRLPWQRDEQPHRTGAQPARPDRHANAGRIERGLGRRRRERDGVRGVRHGRRRIQSHSGAVHRHRRDEADVRARAAHRRDSDVAVSRHAWAPRTLRRRRRASSRHIAGADTSDPLALTAAWNGTPLARLHDDALWASGSGSSRRTHRERR